MSMLMVYGHEAQAVQAVMYQRYMLKLVDMYMWTGHMTWPL